MRDVQTIDVQTITVRIRLRDGHSAGLCRQARAVNIVWNYCNEVQQKAVQGRRKWLSSYDLMKLTAGAGKEMDLHAHTIQRVCRTYDESRRQQKKAWLRWRSKRSLGWVPFNTGHIVFDGSAFIFRGVRYEAMHVSRHIASGMRFGAGSFNADARGRWYVNVPVEIECAAQDHHGAVGVDLGLKTLATLSNGDRIEMPRFFRESEAALARSQQAGKTKRTRAIHARARNRRKDFLHKASKALCEQHGTIVIGDVSPSKLARTSMAKSIHDAGWSGFRSMVRYKAMTHGRRYIEAPEAYSTQTCSACGSRPTSRPEGIAGLRIREWCCDDCGTVHDRDVNAAANILRAGLGTLVEGASHVR